jgi:uncharacterized protein YndB with AHSA1/START domain
VKLVDKTLHIDAPAELVFEILTRAENLVRWMAPVAEVDARPGGRIRWTHANGDSCSGRFLELVPSRRVVFTYGWEREDVQVPPGSTTVEITLIPLGTGTELHLVHRGLPAPMADAHAGGWSNYLHRLTAVAEGRDPGPDRLARERVPSAAELGRP